MLFEYALTIPANTAQADAVELEAPLAPGIVSRVDIQFPRGCVGLVHVQVLKSEHQVWPVNLDGDISAEGLVVSWPEDYELDDDPLAFTLRGWNEDDTFPHTITFRFALLDLAHREASREGMGILRALRRALLGAS